MSQDTVVTPAKSFIALVGFDDALTNAFADCDFGGRELIQFPNSIKMIGDWTDNNLNIVAILVMDNISRLIENS